MSDKLKYQEFCAETYVPIYSQPWWMDAVCGEENWDVWLYCRGDSVLAAMPYYMEKRGDYKYITKAPLTQNNGLIFREDPSRKIISQAEYEEKVINAACDYIRSLKVDVYEQQYQTSFVNWLPFFWNYYSNIVRYTYIINDTSDMKSVWEGISSKYRNKIKKGQELIRIVKNPDPVVFYNEHERVFLRQGKQCPFSLDMWKRLYSQSVEHESGASYFALDDQNNVNAVLFLVWDKRRVYQILGGYMPEYSSNQAYPALIYYGIGIAGEKGLAYDFEGSVIPNISVAFRQFGGIPTPYYRIRKVFNPEVMRMENEKDLLRLQSERDAENSN